MNEFKKLLEQGSISKYDIKEMLNKGELTIDDLIGMLKDYAHLVNSLKELLA